MSMTHPGPVMIPDPCDKLITPAVFQFTPSQHCAAKIRQQMEFLTQTAGMKEGGGLDRFNIGIHFICSLGNFMV